MTKPRGVLLVGSMPLSSAEEVFRVVTDALGDHVRRIPDGETGDRSMWVGWQGQNFKLPQVELVKPTADMYPPTPRFRLLPGADPASLRFGNLGYADAALESYKVFARLKRDGVIPSGVRFQVSIPTPWAPVAMFIVTEQQLEVEPFYKSALLGEVERICDGIPHDQLAIQWDVCIEVWSWEGWLPSPFDDVPAAMSARVATAANAVPADVELGLHLCYGDYKHEHFHQPLDANVLREMVTSVVEKLVRPLGWVHLPVPLDRKDDQFFAPLGELDLPEGTELFLGLVHARDGVAGTRERIATARRHVSGFGVATECGMGRRPADRGGSNETLRELLLTHARVSDPITV